MLFAVIEGRPHLHHRPLTWDGTVGGPEGDLLRDYRVAESFWTNASPLQALLGATQEPSRRLGMVTSGSKQSLNGVGVDWVAPLLQDDPPDDGAQLRGEDLLTLVSKALDQIQDDVNALEEVALATPETPRAAELLDPLLDPLTVVVPPRGLPRLTVGFESDELVPLAAVELLLFLGANGRGIRRCGHCGRPFMPFSRVDEVYCRREAPGEPLGGSICREVGPQQRYQETRSPLQGVYRQVYKRLDLRQRRGGFPRHELDAWREQGRALLAQAQEEEWAEDRLESALEALAPDRQGDQGEDQA